MNFVLPPFNNASFLFVSTGITIKNTKCYRLWELNSLRVTSKVLQENCFTHNFLTGWYIRKTGDVNHHIINPFSTKCCIGHKQKIFFLACFWLAVSQPNSSNQIHSFLSHPFYATCPTVCAVNTFAVFLS